MAGMDRGRRRNEDAAEHGDEARSGDHLEKDSTWEILVNTDILVLCVVITGLEGWSRLKDTARPITQ